MKTLFAIIFALLFYCSVFGQQTEGHVLYEVELEASLETSQIADLYKGSSFEIYFSEEQSRTDMNIGDLAKFSCRANYADDGYLLLMSGLLGKRALPSTVSKINPYLANTESYMVARSQETKTIMGHECNKYILKSSKGVELIYWTTEEIKATLHGQSAVYYEMDGLPLQFEIMSDGLKLIFTASQIDRFLPDIPDLFDMSVPEGYEIISEKVFFGKEIPVRVANN